MLGIRLLQTGISSVTLCIAKIAASERFFSAGTAHVQPGTGAAATQTCDPCLRRTAPRGAAPDHGAGSRAAFPGVSRSGSAWRDLRAVNALRDVSACASAKPARCRTRPRIARETFYRSDNPVPVEPSLHQDESSLQNPRECTGDAAPDLREGHDIAPRGAHPYPKG